MFPFLISMTKKKKVNRKLLNFEESLCDAKNCNEFAFYEHSGIQLNLCKYHSNILTKSLK